LPLLGHAASEGDTLQAWIDYVEEYRQYMEEYKQWAADRFESYENHISELSGQLDEMDSRIQELEGGLEEWRTAYFRAIDDRSSRIQELEEAVRDRDDSIREPEPTPPSCSPGYVRSGTLCVVAPGVPKGVIGGMTLEDYQISEEISRRVMQEREKQEVYLTIDRQAYTLGDVIHVTGKTFVDEWPEKPGSFDTIIPARTEHSSPGINIMHVAGHHDYYEIDCRHPESDEIPPNQISVSEPDDYICRVHYDAHCEQANYPDDEHSCKTRITTPIDPEYNDDGTYSFGLALEDYLPAGEYQVYDYSIHHPADGFNDEFMAVFTLTPPASKLPDQTSVSNTHTEVQNAIGSSTSGCQETNECFIPYEVTVDVGGKVTWSNPDVAAHTVTSGVITDETKGTIFDSGLVAPGSTFSHEFEEAGTYPYFCFVHPWMEGVVIVQAVDDHDEDD